MKKVTATFLVFALLASLIPAPSASSNLALGKSASGGTLGSRPVGSIVMLEEDDVPVEYIVVHQGRPSELYDTSCEGTWLLRKEIYAEREWHGRNNNKYAQSDIYSYLNSTFLNRLDSSMQGVIKQVKIPYGAGQGATTVYGGTNGLSTQIFLLSGYEVGWTSSYFPKDGVCLSYFENSSTQNRIADLNGSACDWWLRSPYTRNAQGAWFVHADGGSDVGDCVTSNGIRPAMVLPAEAAVDSDGVVQYYFNINETSVSINSPGYYTIVGTGEPTTNTIDITGGDTDHRFHPTIILENVNIVSPRSPITSSNWGGCSISMKGNNYLQATGVSRAGISCGDDGTSISGNGTLTAIGGAGAPGIGGSWSRVSIGGTGSYRVIGGANSSALGGQYAHLSIGLNVEVYSTSKLIEWESLVGQGGITVSGTFQTSSSTDRQFTFTCQNQGLSHTITVPAGYSNYLVKLPFNPSLDTYTISQGSAVVYDSSNNSVFNLQRNTYDYSLYGLHAMWPVSFNSNGGSAVGTVNVADGAALSAPAAPTKTGYTFGGWFTDAALQTQYNFSSAVKSSFTLYAKWNPRTDMPYTVQHYQQNLTGSGYTLVETQNLAGTTGANVSASAQSYTGFTLNASHASQVASGTIPASGSLVLKLYYDRNTYTASFNSNGGSAVAAQSGIRYGGTVTTPGAPSKTGYTFGGWYTNSSLTTAYNFSTAVSGNITLYAKWTPRTDTGYKVEHYWQDVSGSGYTLHETQQLTGTTGATATAAARSYTGLVRNASHPSQIVSGTIAANGGLVLRLYYDRSTYTITFSSNGGNAVPSQNGIRYGGSVVEPIAPTRTGYTFGGWFTDTGLTSTYDFSTPVTGGITLYAKWNPRSDTGYTVEHYWQAVSGDEYPFHEAAALAGITDADVTAQPNPYTGLHENTGHADRVPSGKIAPDGSLVLRLYYDRDLHAVTFQSNGGSAVAAQEGIRYGASAVEPAAPGKTGYDFGGWYADEALSNAYDFTGAVLRDITLYARWVPRADTAYRAQHFLQDLEGDGYTRQEVEELVGTTDATVVAGPKTYAGFHENTGHADRVATGQVAPDGSLVLSLYYDRDLHAVTFESNGGSTVANQEGIRYGACAAEPPNPGKTGYDFGGWYADEALSAAYDFSTPVVEDITLYARWVPRTDTAYKVEHYLQDAAGEGYTRQEVEELEGTTDATVVATLKTYAGFHENTGHADRVATGQVAPDGSLVLRLYYDRDLHTVTFESNGGSTVANQEGTRYGASAAEPTAPGKTGYDFGGWYADEALSDAYDFASLITQDITLYARWVARADTAYRVEHYQQNLDGSGYTLHEADVLEGTTDAAVVAVPKTYGGFHENLTHADRAATGQVAPDGSLVLRLYYERDLFTITFESNGGSAVPSQNGIYYLGEAVEPIAPGKTGYDFGGWHSDEALSAAYDFSTPVVEDITLYARWIPRDDTPYKVEHYLQDVEGDGYTLQEVEELVGTTDATVTAIPKSYTGFHENLGAADRVASGRVGPDASLVLQLYYERDRYLVRFDANGGEGGGTPLSVTYGRPFGPLPEAARPDYKFVGWYTALDGGVHVAADSVVKTTGDRTLYAQWVEDDFGVVDGTIVYPDGTPVEGATVTIRAGNVDYKTVTTDAEGRFSILQVKYGIYNLVAEKGGVVVTQKFEIQEKKLSRTLTLPQGKTNSVVEVKDGAPEIVVGGLDALFNEPGVYLEEDAAVVAGGGTVELKMTVEPKDGTAEDAKTLAAKAPGPVLLYLEIGTQKTVAPLEAQPVTTALTELPQLIELFIPLEQEQAGKSEYQVLRLHNGAVDIITNVPNANGEYIKVEGTMVILYARAFSTYALAYAVSSPGRYLITAEAGPGGTVSPEKAVVYSGVRAVVKIIPDAEHQVGRVLVDGKEVESTQEYIFEEVHRDYALVAEFLCPLTAYEDLSTDRWYHLYVDYVLNRSYMVGTEPGRFEPDTIMTRAQMVTLLSRIDGSAPLGTGVKFEDVEATAWYAAPVAWAAEHGVGLGYGDGRFGPGDELTREQLAVMLYRYADAAAAGTAELSRYADGGMVSPWAAEAMQWAVEAGILEGNDKGLLLPRGSASRAEAAAMIYRFLTQ